MMQVTAGESEFKVLCLPKEDYPQVAGAEIRKGIAAVPLGTSRT